MNAYKRNYLRFQDSTIKFTDIGKTDQVAFKDPSVVEIPVVQNLEKRVLLRLESQLAVIVRKADPKRVSKSTAVRVREHIASNILYLGISLQ
jgi:hypothetical protein